MNYDKKILGAIIIAIVSVGTIYAVGSTLLPGGIDSIDREVSKITSAPKIENKSSSKPDCSSRGLFANLRGCDLSNLDLSGVDLKFADLRGADLTNSNLYGAQLKFADFTYAYLHNADLRNVDLNIANLNAADLNGAKLSNANLSGAKLKFANLNGAYLDGTNFNNSDLTGITYDKCIGKPIGVPSIGRLPTCS